MIFSGATITQRSDGVVGYHTRFTCWEAVTPANRPGEDEQARGRRKAPSDGCLCSREVMSSSLIRIIFYLGRDSGRMWGLSTRILL